MNDNGGRRSLAVVLLGVIFVLAEPSEARPQTPGGVAARSLIAPGWGQRTLGQRRGWAYAAVEVGAWAFWIHRRSRGDDLREQYRSAAWTNGRIQEGQRVDGDFAYYEALTKWLRSGAFDSQSGAAGIQPEEDGTTFNGAIWARARDLFFLPGSQPGVGDPRYVQALAYYEGRAYDARFLWDWSGEDAALQEYKRLVVESDDSFRKATTALGAVLANHVLSGADAYLSARVGAAASARVLTGAGGRRWSLVLRVGAQR